MPSLMRRLAAGLPLVLLALASSSSLPREVAAVPVTDLIGVTTNDEPTPGDPAPPGSLRAAIEEVNDAAHQNKENTIEFAAGINNLDISLEDALPGIDIGPDGTVDLDASLTPLLLVAPLDEEATFDILHVVTGHATLIGLDIGGSSFVIDEGAKLGFRYENDIILADEIQGKGTLVKDGAGQMRIDAENDAWTGDIEVVAGELVGSLAALPGNAVIEEGAVLNFDVDSEDRFQDFTKQTSGEGKLYKSGNGTLTVASTTGEMTHTGGTEVQAGGLKTATDRLSGDVVVFADAELELYVSDNDDPTQPPVQPSYDGNISGGGSLRKTGTNKLVLTGSNSFTGGLVIEQGHLTGTADSIPGDVTLQDRSSHVTFKQSAQDGTYAGNISGKGKLIKRGAATLTLTGTNTHEKPTEIMLGTLRGNPGNLGQSIFLNAGGSVDFYNPTTTDHVFDGQISGTGTFIKSGSGLLSLLPDPDPTFQSYSYTGSTLVREGTLSLEADLQTSGTLIVESAGTLLGNSRTFSNNLEAYGTIKPGPDFETFSVGGSATFHAGSTYDVVIDDSQASRLTVTGLTTLDGTPDGGARVFVTVEPGDYSGPMGDGVTHVILTSGVDITTQFATTAPSHAFLDLELIYDDARQVALKASRNSSGTSTFAQTSNQIATGRAFDELLATTSDDVRELNRSLVTLTVEEVPPLLDSLAGEPLAAYANTRLTNGIHFSNAMARRFNAGRFVAKKTPPKAKRPNVYYPPGHPLHEATSPPDEGASAPPKRGPGAAAGSAASWPVDEIATQTTPPSVAAGNDAGAFGPARADGAWGAWLEPFALFGELDGGANSASIDSTLSGALAGIDYQFGQLGDGSRYAWIEKVRVGLAAGYTRTGLEGGPGTMSGTGNSYGTGLYGAYASKRFYLGASARYAYADMSTQRRIMYGSIDRTARASFSGHESGAFIETGMHVGDPRSAYFHPLVSFQYAHVGHAAFDETGAGSLSLEVRPASYDSLRTTLGTRVSRIFTLSGDYGMEPEVRFGWGHEFGDLGREIDARFAGAAAGGQFTTDGAHLDRNEFLIGAGYVMRVSNVPLVSMSYDARIGSAITTHAISASLLLSW